MSLLRLFFVLAILSWSSSGVQAAKPKLEGFLIAMRGECPMDISQTCSLIYKGDIWYVVQGQGYKKEEAIWLVDTAKMEQATDETPYTSYLTLVWASEKKSV